MTGQCAPGGSTLVQFLGVVRAGSVWSPPISYVCVKWWLVLVVCVRLCGPWVCCCQDSGMFGASRQLVSRSGIFTEEREGWCVPCFCCALLHLRTCY